MRNRVTRTTNNPWEILVVAFVFLLPGIALLLRQQPTALFQPVRGRGHMMTLVQSTTEMHVIGLVATGAGVSFVILYFYTRLSMAREERNRSANVEDK